MSDMSSFVEAASKFLATEISEANVFATQLLNANNSVALLHEFRDEAETTDETILGYRKFIDEVNERFLSAQAKIEAYILENKLIDTEPVDVEKVTASYKEKASLIVNQLKTLATIPGSEEFTKNLPALIKPAGSRASSNSGTPISRPRVSQIFLNGEEIFTINADGKKIVTMSVLALHLSKITKTKVEGTALREAMFEAANTKDLSSLNGTPVDFSFSVADKNYSVHVVPAL